MSQVAAIKAKQEPDAQAFGVGNLYQMLILKVRTPNFGNVHAVAVGTTLDLGADGGGLCRSITRVSSQHFRCVFAEPGSAADSASIIIAEDAVAGAIEVKVSRVPAPSAA